MFNCCKKPDLKHCFENCHKVFIYLFIFWTGTSCWNRFYLAAKTLIYTNLSREEKVTAGPPNDSYPTWFSDTFSGNDSAVLVINLPTVRCRLLPDSGPSPFVPYSPPPPPSPKWRALASTCPLSPIYYHMCSTLMWTTSPFGSSERWEPETGREVKPQHSSSDSAFSGAGVKENVEKCEFFGRFGRSTISHALGRTEVPLRWGFSFSLSREKV